MPTKASPTFPTFDTSDFGGAGGPFYFDLVRLQDRDDIPRAFPHRHNYYHLLWMTEGHGAHMLDFEQFELRANTVFFVSPGQIHAWTSSTRPKGYVINFSTEFFVQMLPRSDDIAQFPFFHIARDTPALYLEQSRHDELLPLLFDIEKEVLNREDGRFDIVRSYLLILLTRLRRLYPMSITEGMSPQSYCLTKRFKLLLDEHFLEFGPVRDYAAKLHITDRQLNDAIKRTMGCTAGQLLHERIVLEAKRLLSNTHLSVSEIAFQLNFDDLAYFCRFFKKHTQLTPGQFKQRYSGPME